MKRMVVLAWTLAAACGGVDEDRSGCAESADCGAGEYCADTPDGKVCWPDAVAPAVSAVKVTCAAPCVRDGVLRVEAAVQEDRQLAAVQVALDLEPSRRVSMARAGQVYAAELRLDEWPFPAFQRAVVATVTATDGARNEHAVVAPAEQQPVVTRARWTYDAGVPMTSPAVMADGTAIVGLSATSAQVLAVKPDGTKAWDATVGTAFVGVPPAVSDDAMWVGTQNGGLFALPFAGGVVQATCSPAAPIIGAPAIVGTRAIVSSQAGVLVLADSASFCDQTPIPGALTTGPVVSTSGHVLAPAASALHSYSIPADGVLRTDWTGIPPAPPPPTIGENVTAAMSIDSSESVWTVAQNGSVNRTFITTTVTASLATLPASSSGAVILGDGTAVFGSTAGALERIGDQATPPWVRSAQLNGWPAVPLALRGPSTSPSLLVPTSTGRLYAVSQDDGQVLWSVKLSATEQALQPANLHGTPGARTATAYLAGADGKLHAIVVDGQLDTTAPWPKAFHDPRNTSNAGTRP